MPGVRLIKTPRLVAVAALHMTVVLFTACGGETTGSSPSTPTAPTPATPPPVSTAPNLGAVDPALVGTWIGTLNGSFGPGTFTMNLTASGRFQNEGSGNYCAVSGTWGVSAGQFSAVGPDCTGTIDTFKAPVSAMNLSGEWTASSGRVGTFICTKQ